MNPFLPQFTTRGQQSCFPLFKNAWDSREAREEGEGVRNKQGLRNQPALPHSRWRHGSGEVPQRRYQRMRSAESRPGTQDGGSGAGEGEAEAAKREVEQNV